MHILEKNLSGREYNSSKMVFICSKVSRKSGIPVGSKEVLRIRVRDAVSDLAEHIRNWVLCPQSDGKTLENLNRSMI